MIEFLLDSMDLIRVFLGILSGFFAGIWFSLSMMTWFERNPYRIVDPKPEPSRDYTKYEWSTPKNFRNPSGGS